jgi:hypothetical protein
MNAEVLLSSRADEILLPGDFSAIGSPALLVTNEITPAGFHDGVRETAAPDGWIFGPGCGNVLAMIEAFGGPPRGFVLVDVDPAVVCAGRMLVTALRRYPDVASFSAGFFCGGRETLLALENEVLAAEPSPSLRAAMNGQRERLWRSLATLTGGFSQRSGDAASLLAEWAAYYPPAGQVVPVRTFLARSYDRFREIAVRGDIVVLCSSLFHPILLDAVAALPGWRGSRNLIYLSNVSDHLLRRALIESARARLGIVAGAQERVVRSIAEFVSVLNAQQVGALRAVDTPGTAYVLSSAQNNLTLVMEPGFPIYKESDFDLDFDLDRNVVRFFEAFAVAPLANGGLPTPWREARSLRSLVLRLYSAGVRGDEEALRALAPQLAGWMERQPDEDPVWSAFWLAEAGHALLALRRLPLAVSVLPDIQQVLEAVSVAATALHARSEPFQAAASEQPLQTLLVALALALAGDLCGGIGAATLLDAGRSRFAAALKTGRFSVPGAPVAGCQAESLLRLTVWNLLRPEDILGTALAGAAETVLSSIQPNGSVIRDAAGEPGSGYAAYLADPEVLFETVKLALLFYGLSAEQGLAIEAALLVDYHSRHRDTADAPDTDVLLGATR